MTNGSALRRLPSWIDEFVNQTNNLEAPAIFRKWSAIVAISSILEQKVWLTTSSPIYPNLYVFLVGHPGTGKTRTIRAAREYMQETPEYHIAPQSLTWASLVDALVRNKRNIVRPPAPAVEYNSMAVIVDELGKMIHKYDKEMADGLSALYDQDIYDHERRGGEIRIKIKSPQVNMLCGSTPSNLLETLPESAWGQGFTSRVIMVFSDERIIGDDFAETEKGKSKDLIHDLNSINNIYGGFKVTPDYRDLINSWRQNGETVSGFTVPNHPKLIHYNARRKVNLYKLSMVAAIDRGEGLKTQNLLLTRDDFNKAMSWLVEAEVFMADIFKAGATNADAKAQEEAVYLVRSTGPTGIGEQKLVRFLSERIPSHSVMKALDLMQAAGMIRARAVDPRTGQRVFVATPDE